MELKVRALGDSEEKSVQEIEQELVEKHEPKEEAIPKIDLSNLGKKEEVVVK